MANKLEYILDLSPEEFKKKLKAAGVDVGGLDGQLKQVGKTGKKTFSSLVSGIGSFTLGLNQGLELLSKVVGTVKELSNKAIELDKRTTIIEKRFKTTGERARKLNSEMEALSDTFAVDFYSQLNAANALMKEFGINSEISFKLLEEAALKAPDQFNEILEQVKEYSSQAVIAKLSTEEFLTIVTRSIQDGIWSDKGIDSIKEAALTLTRELTPAAEKALKDIGITGRELQDQIENGSITTFEAIKKISKEIDILGIDSQKTKTVITEIFKAAGEDAGKFILSVDKMPSSLKEVEDQTGELQKKQLALNKELAKTEGFFTRLYSGFFKTKKSPAQLLAGAEQKGYNELLIIRKQIEAVYKKGLKRDRLLTDEVLSQIEEAGTSLDKINSIINKKAEEQLSKFRNIVTEQAQVFKKFITGTEQDEIDAWLSPLLEAEKEFRKLQESGLAIGDLIEDEGEELPDLTYNKAREKELNDLYVERVNIFGKLSDDRKKELDELILGYETESQLENESQQTKIDNINAQDEAEKMLFDAQIERNRQLIEERQRTQEEFANLTKSSLGVLFNSLIVQQDSVFKAIGEGTRNLLVNVLDMWAKAEIAKLTFSSWTTFGASLAGILPILGALEAAKAGLSAIKFEDGGSFDIGGKRHSQGGTKFIGSDGTAFEAEKGEKLFILNRGASQAYNELNSLNSQFIGRKYENGGLVGMTPTISVSPQVNLGNQTIILEIDGQVVAARVNLVNNNNRDSGQILTENT